MKELRVGFNLMDQDGNGILDFNEITDFLESLGISCSKEQLKMAFMFADQDHNEEVDFDEFVKMLGAFALMA